MRPRVGRRPGETRNRRLAILQASEVPGKAGTGQERLERLAVNQAADLFGYVKGVGSRRFVGLTPFLVGLDRLAADELQRLSGGLVSKRLALQMPGDGEDLKSPCLRFFNSLRGVSGRSLVIGTPIELQLPAGFLPAVEAGSRYKIDPFIVINISELPAHQANLVVRAPAGSMLSGLLVSHGDSTPAIIGFPVNMGILRPGKAG